MKKKYRTTKDILIPAGTDIDVHPSHRRVVYCTDLAFVLTAITRDVTSEWHMDLGEAIKTGVVEEVS
jgi:hypothetical protein